jgi:hypothetical protein
VRRDPTFPGPWPAEPLGTLVPWPNDGALFHVIQHEWQGRSEQRGFFVLFDEAQYDTDGAGPYYKAEVWECYLERVDD